MRTFFKRALVLLLAMTLLFSCVPPKTVEAKKKYSYGSYKNPVKMGSYGKCKSTWKVSAYLYYKFTMPKQGYANITITNKKSTPYWIFIYDKKGRTMWDCRTDGQKKYSTSKNYNYKVGLKKGTYILGVKPMNRPPRSGFKSTVTVKAVANKYWETENNDSFETATTLKIFKKYTGVYGENISGIGDYYKIALAAGYTYQFQIGNANSIFNSRDTVLCKIYDPNQKEVKAYGSYSYAGYRIQRDIIQNTGVVTIDCNETGYYYLKIYNSQGFKNPGYKYTVKVR
jgi:hypothetical protein